MPEYVPANFVIRGSSFQHSAIINPNPSRVTGESKLGMRLIAVMLTDSRVSNVAHAGGTLLPEVISSGSSSIAEVQALMVIGLAAAVQQIKAYDAEMEAAPLNEQLDTAHVVSVAYNAASEIITTIEVIPISGASTIINPPTRFP